MSERKAGDLPVFCHAVGVEGRVCLHQQAFRQKKQFIYFVIHYFTQYGKQYACLPTSVVLKGPTHQIRSA